MRSHERKRVVTCSPPHVAILLRADEARFMTRLIQGRASEFAVLCRIAQLSISIIAILQRRYECDIFSRDRPNEALDEPGAAMVAERARRTWPRCGMISLAPPGGEPEMPGAGSMR
jgi:hypothetical protein